MFTLILPHFLHQTDEPLPLPLLPSLNQIARFAKRQHRPISTADLYQHHLCDQLHLPENHVYASPLSQQIGMNSVHIQHGAPLAMTASEAETLCAGLNQLYGDDAHFQPLRPDLWRIQLSQPADWQIENIFNLHHILQPDSAPPAWLQLYTETQMWLHAHPINQNRKPCPINSLWIWNAPLPQPLHRYTAIATDSAWISHSSQNTQKLPEHFDAWQSYCQSQHIDLSNTSIFSEAFLWANEPYAYAEILADWEQRFFAPIVRAIRSGSLNAVRIISESVEWQIKPLSFYHFWKPKRGFNGKNG